MASIAEWEESIRELPKGRAKMIDKALGTLQDWDLFESEFQGLDTLRILLYEWKLRKGIILK